MLNTQFEWKIRLVEIQFYQVIYLIIDLIIEWISGCLSVLHSHATTHRLEPGASTPTELNIKTTKIAFTFLRFTEFTSMQFTSTPASIDSSSSSSKHNHVNNSDIHINNRCTRIRNLNESNRIQISTNERRFIDGKVAHKFH